MHGLKEPEQFASDRRTLVPCSATFPGSGVSLSGCSMFLFVRCPRLRYCVRLENIRFRFHTLMDKREFTHSGPLMLDPPKDRPGTFFACLTHTGKTFQVGFILPSEAPAFINPKTGEVCHSMLPLTWKGEDFSRNLAHEKIRLAFDDCLVDPNGKTRHREWKWSDWVPYHP